MANWKVEFHSEFALEFFDLAEEVQDAITLKRSILSEFGHNLGRPIVDTLIGSKFANMKEMRLDADNGVWRVAFAFDPERKAILLVAGDKAGISQKRFYKGLIDKADQRFESHLENLKMEKLKGERK